MENIVIRNIKEEDIPSIVDITINSWKKAYKGIIDDNVLNSMNRQEKMEKLRKSYKKDRYIVAEINEEIVGFCRYIDNNSYTPNILEIDCEIVALYVKPIFKYNGIGTKMVQFVINEFRNEGKTKMIIWCLKDNKPSRKFYTKMGGKIMKEKVYEKGGKKYIEVGFQYTI